MRKQNASGIGFGMLSAIAGDNGKKAGNQEKMTNENVDSNRAARWERQQLIRIFTQTGIAGGAFA